MEKVSFFNHKGGVGKTTLVYNVGLAMESLGKRIVFIDLDAQANLTSSAIPAEKIEEFFVNKKTVYGFLKPMIDGTGDLERVDPVPIRENAWILPGDIRISEFEEILPQGWTEALAGQPRGFLVSTAVHRLIDMVGSAVNADYAVIDLGPNVGALNRVSILASDGFVVPLAPDLFSLTALPSVGKSASRWMGDWKAAIDSARRRDFDPSFDIPAGEPSPLGYLSQQFAVYREAPAIAYRRWIERIPKAYNDGIVKPLEGAGARIPAGDPKIGEIRNLSSLVPMAQKTHSAIFELSGSEARGAQFTRARDTYSLFCDIGSEIMRRLEYVR